MSDEAATDWPWKYRRRWPDEFGDYTVTIQLGLVHDAAGAEHLDAVSVTLASETHPITSTTLRRLQVWTLVRKAIAEQVERFIEIGRQPPSLGTTVMEQTEHGLTGHVVREDITRESREQFWDRYRDRAGIADATRRPRGRRRQITDEHLRAVADIHTRERGLHRDPRTAVATYFQTSPSTAARWITAARDRGFLPPSGRARKPKETT